MVGRVFTAGRRAAITLPQTQITPASWLGVYNFGTRRFPVKRLQRKETDSHAEECVVSFLVEPKPYTGVELDVIGEQVSATEVGIAVECVALPIVTGGLAEVL